jgi:hypothetical protein
MSLVVMLMALSCASRECNASWVEGQHTLIVGGITLNVLFLEKKGSCIMSCLCDLFLFFCVEWLLSHRCRVLFDFWVTLASVIAQHFYWKLPKFEFVAANVYGFVLKHFLYKFGVF